MPGLGLEIGGAPDVPGLGLETEGDVPGLGLETGGCTRCARARIGSRGVHQSMSSSFVHKRGHRYPPKKQTTTTTTACCCCLFVVVVVVWEGHVFMHKGQVNYP